MPWRIGQSRVVRGRSADFGSRATLHILRASEINFHQSEPHCRSFSDETKGYSWAGCKRDEGREGCVRWAGKSRTRDGARHDPSEVAAVWKYVPAPSRRSPSFLLVPNDAQAAGSWRQAHSWQGVPLELRRLAPFESGLPHTMHATQ